MVNIVAGIVAHVDAGKTTLSEAILYRSDMVRKLGRVDKGSAFLDTDALEKKRGITIFPHEAVIKTPSGTITLLDTPGHADFAASSESVIPVLDVAILVVPASDGIQGSTRLLWRLLKRSGIPVIIFINKCDVVGADPAAVLSQLQADFSSQIVPFTPLPTLSADSQASVRVDSQAKADETNNDAQARIPTASLEQMASASDELIDDYLTAGTLTQSQIRHLVASRRAFPCFFGSALKLDGISELIDAVSRWSTPRYQSALQLQQLQSEKSAPKSQSEKSSQSSQSVKSAQPAPFSARVFRISHEGGQRLTWLRVESGQMEAKQELLPGEKADEIRNYDGAHFTTVRHVGAGEIATVTGLTSTRAGQGIGIASSQALVQPVLESSVEAPSTDPQKLGEAIRELADEEPQLSPQWRGHGNNARLVVRLMGELEEQILVSELADRFGITASFGQPQILYTETIAAPVEGVSHFEPLRHYAEVHVRLDPAPRGSGISADSELSTDDLAASWQHQILSRLSTHTPIGVLTGSPVTDLRITLVAARASNVHTVGGDFRQAADRAVRMGLMRLRTMDRGAGTGAASDAGSSTGGVVLLEPWQSFRLEVPEDMVGRALNDIQRRGGEATFSGAPDGRAVIEGAAPVAGLQGYARQARAYSHGQASLEVTPAPARPVADPGSIINRIGYDPVLDTDNPVGSVFCAHGAGYPVAWNRVPEIMHLPWAETNLPHEEILRSQN